MKTYVVTRIDKEREVPEFFPLYKIEVNNKKSHQKCPLCKTESLETSVHEYEKYVTYFDCNNCDEDFKVHPQSIPEEFRIQL